MEATCVSSHELGQLRAEIDDLDEQIIKLLGQRFIATGKVGVIKAAQSLEAIDPAREAAQAQRYSALAERYGVDVDLTQKLFRGVIDEVVANHRVIRENAS
nr:MULTISPECIES: chorismate mutase [unclassified Pseudomonas]